LSYAEDEFRKLLLDTIFVSSIVIGVPLLICLFVTRHSIIGIFFSVLFSFIIIYWLLFRKSVLLTVGFQNKRHFHIKKLKKDD